MTSSSSSGSNEDKAYQDPTPTKPNLGSSTFQCTWLGCDQSKTFARRSDLTKHMDKHTRPYTCHNPTCTNVDFGDKAGLRRHERERHGVVKFCCSIPSCRRHVKGFARKRNLDLHVKTCHRVLIGQGGSGETVAEDGISESSKMVEEEDEGEGEEEEEMSSGVGSERRECSIVESTSLQVKLQELEAEKRELEMRQSRVDEDILALKRVLQIVSS
ncbi:hypothetical protein IFR05_008497 [Cadophora sp. M221]|nr:hypothetical protein IFR05_008497 [Cadophora sp. M221]